MNHRSRLEMVLYCFLGIYRWIRLHCIAFFFLGGSCDVDIISVLTIYASHFIAAFNF